MLSLILTICSILSLGTYTTRPADQSSGHTVQVDDVQQGTGTGH